MGAREKVGAVDAYVEKQPAEARPVLQRVRGIIRKALPEAEEAIGYGIPAYRVDGRYVVYFAGWKRHWSLYPVTEGVRKALGDALDPYEVSKGTVRFPLGEPVPARLVERVVRLLARAARDRRTRRSRRGRNDPGRGA